MLLSVNSSAVKIVAVCFITGGMYPAVVLFLTWLTINSGGFTKRATTWAMAEVFAQLFSIMGAHLYEDGAPRFGYYKGAFFFVFLFLTLLFSFLLFWR